MFGSLVPRLPWSGTRTLKLCRAWYFLSCKNRRGRETLIVCGCTQKLEQEKEGRVTHNLLHVSGDQGANIIRTKHWTHSWLNNVQNIALKTQVLFWLHHGHVRKDTRLSPRTYLSVPEWGSLGTRPSIRKAFYMQQSQVKRGNTHGPVLNCSNSSVLSIQTSTYINPAMRFPLPPPSTMCLHDSSLHVMKSSRPRPSMLQTGSN